MPRPAHPALTGPVGPFVGYRVTLAPRADHQCLAELAATHTGLRPLLGQSRATSIALPTTAATALYDAAEATAREHTAPFPLHFTPIRCVRGRALPFRGRGSWPASPAAGWPRGHAPELLLPGTGTRPERRALRFS